MSKSTCANCGQSAKDEDFDEVCTVTGREHNEAELSATKSDADAHAEAVKAEAAASKKAETPA